MKNKKTLWQKIYSFLGFWTYTENLIHSGAPSVELYLNSNAIGVDSQGEKVWIEKYEQTYTKTERVLYWCCFPFWYIRKFDICRWKIDPRSI